MKNEWNFLSKIYKELKNNETVSFDMVSEGGNPVTLKGTFRDSDGIMYELKGDEENGNIVFEIYVRLGIMVSGENRRLTFTRTRTMKTFRDYTEKDIIEIVKSKREETFLIDKTTLDLNGIELINKGEQVELPSINEEYEKYKELTTPDDKGFFKRVYYYVNQNGSKMSIKKIDEDTYEIKISLKK